MPDSDRGYGSRLRAHWWGGVLTSLSALSLVVGTTILDVARWPPWSWAIAAVSGLVYAQYKTFDDMRTERDDARTERDQVVRAQVKPVDASIVRETPLVNDEGWQLYLLIKNESDRRGIFSAKVRTMNGHVRPGPVPPWSIKWRHGLRRDHPIDAHDSEYLIVGTVGLVSADAARRVDFGRWHAGLHFLIAQNDGGPFQPHPAAIAGVHSVDDLPSGAIHLEVGVWEGGMLVATSDVRFRLMAHPDQPMLVPEWVVDGLGAWEDA